MDRNILRQIIIDQREEQDVILKNEKIIERELLSVQKETLDSGIIKVISGIRRCGKSTFAHLLLKNKQFAYLNLDDERLIALKTNDLNKILEIFYEIYGQPQYILLDEIQNIPGWELFTNRLKRQGFNVIITGSNANLLSKELATHLTGRHIAVELFPFSFREYLDYQGIPFNSPLSTRERALIKRELSTYIETGGFPETLKKNIMPKIYLRALYSTIIEKDIVIRHGIRLVKTFKDIANYLLSNHSNLMSFNKLKNIYNLKSIHTAKDYASYLEESYLFFFLKKMAFKQGESHVAPRKTYCIDTGLINALSLKFSPEWGKIYENIVAVELLRRTSIQEANLYYWQGPNKNEVDFVVKKGLPVNQLIQVCYDSSHFDTRKREIRSLMSASRMLGCRDLLIITDNEEGTEKIKDRKIRFIPLWKWLLEKP